MLLNKVYNEIGKVFPDLNQVKDIIIICPICKKIPSMKLTINNKLSIRCTCTYTIEMYLEDVLNLLVENKESSEILHSQLKKNYEKYNHYQGKKYEKQYYCISEKVYFCSYNKQYHNNHRYVDLKEYNKSIDFDTLFANIVKALKLIHSITDDLQKDYQILCKHFIQKNTNIIKFILILINCYYVIDSLNYNCITNLMNYSKFELKPYIIPLDSNEEQKKKIIEEYLSSYKIIKISAYDELTVIHSFNYYKGYSIESMILLSDGRLAIATLKEISIYNLVSLQADFIIKDAHKDTIYSLCQIQNERLLSSAIDQSFNIWSITQNSYKLEHTIINPNDTNLNPLLLNLSHNRFALCNRVKSVTIYNSNHPYNDISILETDKDVICLTQLINREVLVIGAFQSLTFYELTEYKKIHSMTSINCNSLHSVFEFKEGKLALSSTYPNSITIIDCNTYQIEFTILGGHLFFNLSSFHIVPSFLFCKGKNGNFICCTPCGHIVQIDSLSYEMFYSSAQIHSNEIMTLLSLNDSTIIAGTVDGRIIISSL